MRISAPVVVILFKFSLQWEHSRQFVETVFPVTTKIHGWNFNTHISLSHLDFPLSAQEQENKMEGPDIPGPEIWIELNRKSEVKIIGHLKKLEVKDHPDVLA